ncbi:hypothetical protein FBQ87_13380 [Sphingobacteriales bacterium CHB3]|nr:hypothetical protein [Sphingobacteriales bacterium CHB3]
MTDTQFDTFEVFHQKKKGDPHIHVGSVHAPDPQIALQYARDQFARRPCLPRPHIHHPAQRR